jgi:O-antigen ligase
VFNHLTTKFFSLALFLVGAATLAMPSGYSLGFYLICFASLGLWFKARDSLLPKEARYFLWPLLAYGVGLCLLALRENFALREIDTHLPFLFVFFGFWGLRKYKPNADWFWLGLAVGAMLAACLAGYQSMQLGMRAEGFGNHPIQFGNIALLLGVLGMVRVMAVFRWCWLNLFLWLGFAAGLAASVWSQTRGGWVAVILVFVWIFTNATKSWGRIKRVVVAIALFGILAVPALQSGGLVQSRINEAVTEVSVYFENGKQDTSVGARLAMWHLGIDGIANAPLLGLGHKGWLEMRDSAIADGRLSSFSGGLTHLHNEYLNVTFKRGFLGLVLLMSLYLVPMMMFFRPHLHDSRENVRALAMAGMVIPMMFMDFGLTQAFLSHNSGRIVLCGLWMCVAALMLNATLNQESNNVA